MSSDVLIIVGVVVCGFIVLYVLLRKAASPGAQTQQLEQIVNQVFGMSVNQIAQQSRQILASDKDAIKSDLENKQRVIEQLVKQLQDDLRLRQDEIRTLEKDRTQKFSEIVTQLDQHRRLTDELKTSTQQLASVLSNNQTRGEWGERIIEDLMQANGLVEGVHYLKQTKLETTSLRPDISLLLPNKRVVPVDVKFPYAEIQKLSVADTKAARDGHVRQFGSDLKDKINKVEKYIDPSFNTMDYAILFVPNEMVFSFINQRFPELVDDAIARKVLIVSPFTFLIVARTVMESYRNFMIGDKLKDVVKYVDEFVKEWLFFKEKFTKYGRSLDTLKTDYEELTTTRVRQMERRLEKIENVWQGGLLVAGKKEISE